MRRWKRAVVTVRCGACPSLIPAGDPAQEVILPGMKRSLVRCRGCADGDVPPDLPAVMETTAPAGMVRFQPSLLPRDFKLAQAGEREPGEEG